jgi:hypothetical protein
MTPDQVALLAAAVGRGPAYDIVIGIGPDTPIAELAAAGATWGIAGMLRPQEPLDEVRARLLPGPPR